MRTVIYNARAVLTEKILQGAGVVIDGAKISSVSRMPISSRSRRGGLALNARGNYVSAGFIDTHIHGLPGRIFEHEVRFGTTSILPTASCASREALGTFIKAVLDFINTSPFGPNVAGIRLEGPFINPAKAGAQDRRYIRKPDRAWLKGLIAQCSGRLKIMTLAPEEKGALSLVRALKAYNVLASIGHSNATYREAVDGVKAGIAHSTHTFNAMSGLSSREPGAVGAVLERTEVVAEVIADLIHVHRALLKILLDVKGVDRVIVATDSVACERPKGARRTRGAFRLSDGALAGSHLTMNRAVENAMRAGRLSLPEAVRLATLNPARLLGIEKKGRLAAGGDADIVIFDERFNVLLTMIGGRIVHKARGL
jgi:N-acetylglucosamine-6-phosphate deacetylase